MNWLTAKRESAAREWLAASRLVFNGSMDVVEALKIERQARRRLWLFDGLLDAVSWGRR